MKLNYLKVFSINWNTFYIGNIEYNMRANEKERYE